MTAINRPETGLWDAAGAVRKKILLFERELYLLRSCNGGIHGSIRETEKWATRLLTSTNQKGWYNSSQTFARLTDAKDWAGKVEQQISVGTYRKPLPGNQFKDLVDYYNAEAMQTKAEM